MSQCCSQRRINRSTGGRRVGCLPGSCLLLLLLLLLPLPPQVHRSKVPTCLLPLPLRSDSQAPAHWHP